MCFLCGAGDLITVLYAGVCTLWRRWREREISPKSAPNNKPEAKEVLRSRSQAAWEGPQWVKKRAPDGSEWSATLVPALVRASSRLFLISLILSIIGAYWLTFSVASSDCATGLVDHLYYVVE